MRVARAAAAAERGETAADSSSSSSACARRCCSASLSASSSAAGARRASSLVHKPCFSVASLYKMKRAPQKNTGRTLRKKPPEFSSPDHKYSVSHGVLGRCERRACRWCSLPSTASCSAQSGLTHKPCVHVLCARVIAGVAGLRSPGAWPWSYGHDPARSGPGLGEQPWAASARQFGQRGRAHAQPLHLLPAAHLLCVLQHLRSHGQRSLCSSSCVACSGVARRRAGTAPA